MTLLSYHSSNLSLMALEAMQLLVLNVKDFFTFTEEILHGKLHFWCSNVNSMLQDVRDSGIAFQGKVTNTTTK